MIKPEKQFYIFGMGHREKYIYKNSALIEFKTNNTVYYWDVEKEEFIYDKYTVILGLKNGETVIITENTQGVFIKREKNAVLKEEICLADDEILLPDFEEYKYPAQLRILHQELLISFLDKFPVPNFYVYKTPWYRDGAMMALALEKTGNISLLKDWALSITELYDKNNSGNSEPDNLGQLAYILSFFVDKEYPLVKKIVEEAKRITVDGVLTGLTDYGHHEIYSTLWLKFGLERLGIDTSFIKIPKEFDSYAYMFWMDRAGIDTSTPYENEYNEWYPYLWWAVKHFKKEPIDEKYLEIKYPMSWEICASEARYELIAPLSEEYAKNKCGSPHSWHAAEMFMYLLEMKKGE
ncbi:MAG: hypothetical protein J6B60_02815 [Clostridia bacterium]|nr:hypothetical protein [Clostridia bacterium]